MYVKYRGAAPQRVSRLREIGERWKNYWQGWWNTNRCLIGILLKHFPNMCNEMSLNMRGSWGRQSLRSGWRWWATMPQTDESLTRFFRQSTFWCSPSTDSLGWWTDFSAGKSSKLWSRARYMHACLLTYFNVPRLFTCGEASRSRSSKFLAFSLLLFFWTIPN